MLPIDFESILADLRKRYGNTSFLPIEIFAPEMGLAVQTARNMIAGARFPVPSRTVGRKRLVRVHDLAQFILNENHFSHLIKPKKPSGRGRGRGRPTKAEQAARAAQAAGQ